MSSLDCCKLNNYYRHLWWHKHCTEETMLTKDWGYRKETWVSKDRKIARNFPNYMKASSSFLNSSVKIYLKAYRMLNEKASQNSPLPVVAVGPKSVPSTSVTKPNTDMKKSSSAKTGKRKSWKKKGNTAIIPLSWMETQDTETWCNSFSITLKAYIKACEILTSEHSIQLPLNYNS